MLTIGRYFIGIEQDMYRNEYLVVMDRSRIKRLRSGTSTDISTFTKAVHFRKLLSENTEGVQLANEAAIQLEGIDASEISYRVKEPTELWVRDEERMILLRFVELGNKYNTFCERLDRLLEFS
ncbi:hypothetical protein HYV86_07200 [Candidatus Woesearchaeota archaeon]|nr:hypothetical protein [Candidatus Woesearchaeota archaeon]